MIIFYGFFWLISIGMAGGILMNAIAGIPYEIVTAVILGVCVTYTLFGGLYAVIGTDYIQTVLIMIGVVIIGIAVFQAVRSEEHTSELQSLMRISYAVFCLKKKKNINQCVYIYN